MENEWGHEMTEHVKTEWYGNEHKLSDGSYVDKDGNFCYVKNGVFHREDGPAVIQLNGTIIWCLDGKKHREGGPAVESVSGYKAWYKNGVLHRNDGPAVTDSDGTEEWWIDGVKTAKDETTSNGKHTKVEWYDGANDKLQDNLPDGSYIDKYGDVCYIKNGKRHREDGPAVERPDGTKSWWVNGKRHREDGPAVEWANGDKLWYTHGKRHREDGPAIEYADGTKKWYLNGEECTKEEFDKKVMGEKVIDEKTSNGKHKNVEWNIQTVTPTLSDGSYIDRRGDVGYVKSGKLHREDGPAVEFSYGAKYWYRNGKMHREDGPAVECNDGRKEWWIDGRQYSYSVYERMLARAGGATILNWYEIGTRNLKDGCYMSHEGDICYVKNGCYYVQNGYAVVWADGRKEHKFISGSYAGRF